MTKHIIVIGGGLGGISAAIRMAQSGYSVSLYEQNTPYRRQSESS